MKTIDDFNFKDKTALIRVDFNVPLNEVLEVTDGTRIAAARSSIIKILEDGGRCVLMSHLGRPKGREQEFSLANVVDTASEILGVNVQFVNDCIGDQVRQAVDKLSNGEILLLENLRYYPEEKQGDADFAQQLAEWGDIYVNDAFGTAHRAHASTAVIAQFFPEDKCAGHLLAAEIENVNKVLTDSQPPVTAIIGGAKVSSKITIIENILDRIDHLIIGGGMAFTFVKAKGGEVGDSLVEDDKQALALEILAKAAAKDVQVHLPVDTLTADRFAADAHTEVQDITQISPGRMGLDAGPETIASFRQVVLDSSTLLWNGPVGVFEMEVFAKGTIAIGQAIADATTAGAFSLVGGGDSVAAAKQFGFTKQVSYVSTGGGAMLEMLEGKTLPGIAALG